jgi:uncharacterized Zn-finger protein
VFQGGFMKNDKFDIPCTKKHIQVTKDDLPLSCPMPAMRLWDGHPRVYLPIEESGHEICPYCGVEYTLLDSPVLEK